MNWLWNGVHHALIMTWETLWALVFGFAVSAALQVFVSKEQMGRLFGRANLQSIALATGFGAASSSCSYAAAAAGRSAFKQGAALIPALAFMFASTNLVVELGGILWLLIGWRFVLAEVVGAFVLIGLMWVLARLIFPKDLEQEVRNRMAGEKDKSEGHCHHASAKDEDSDCEHSLDSHQQLGRWKAMADSFLMDWQMLWKEIAIGFLIAGYLMALVPMHAWQVFFLQGGPIWLRQLENALVGPLVAIGSFVCSVGNIPLASVLWSGGISFGGVIAFIYADLLIIPLVLIYRKYYGGKAAAYITGIFYTSMVGAGLLVDWLFTVFGLVPTGPRPPPVMEQAHFSWNYTTWLDLAAVVVFIAMWILHSNYSSPGGMEKHDQVEDHATHHAS